MARTLALLATCTTALVAAPAAVAAVPHTVGPGETLWGIAAANNFTTRALAAYNGLSPDANVVLGSTIQVPTVAEAAGALARAGLTPAPGAVSGAGTTAASASAAPPAQGAYTVRPGDTLSALAARAGVPMAQMAYMNGLDPKGILRSGTLLKLPTGAAPPTRADQPAPAQTVVPAAAPAPTGDRLTGDQVRALAAEQGAPSDLAAAIGWQESGFNNRMVSSANARGVMQVMPGTWDWVQQNLTTRRLDPNSPADNVRAGALYLNRLLRETGGDPALAAAGYYQGLASVRRIGMLPETRRYVANVLALRQRFAE
jgi:soluble lytic murein transglycosylase-like protein